MVQRKLFDDDQGPHPVCVVPQKTNAELLLAELDLVRLTLIEGARRLSPTKDNLRHIEARLKAGNTVDDVRHVIAVCAAEVRRDASAARWLNAVTPFRADNFARNLAKVVEQPRGAMNQGSRSKLRGMF